MGKGAGATRGCPRPGPREDGGPSGVLDAGGEGAPGKTPAGEGDSQDQGKGCGGPGEEHTGAEAGGSHEGA